MFQNVNGKLMFTDAFYAFSKKLVQVYIPALSTFYFALSPIWNLPAAGQVSGTLAALATLIGVSLGISSKSYDNSGKALIDLDHALAKEGELVVHTDLATGRKVFSLNLNGDPEELEKKGSITFKVTKPSE